VLAIGVPLLPSVVTYYSTSQRDSDVQPIAAYPLAHARHGADAKSDPAHLLPMYIGDKLNYYSRDAISYLWWPKMISDACPRPAPR
jgi:hypothetical protein